MDLCLTEKRRPGPRAETRWWEQENLDLEGMQTSDWEAEYMEGGGGCGWDRDRDRRLIK